MVTEPKWGQVVSDSLLYPATSANPQQTSTDHAFLSDTASYSSYPRILSDTVTCCQLPQPTLVLIIYLIQHLAKLSRLQLYMHDQYNSPGRPFFRLCTWRSPYCFRWYRHRIDGLPRADLT
jgi:hypothetical protein